MSKGSPKSSNVIQMPSPVGSNITLSAASSREATALNTIELRRSMISDCALYASVPSESYDIEEYVLSEYRTHIWHGIPAIS